MQRREFLKASATVGAVAILTPAAIFEVGCSKQTVAELVQTLGNAAANIAQAEGNTSLAQKLQTDTAAAVSAITNWQTGSPAQMAIEALNLVVDDLNLFPIAAPYAPLIDLAIGTAISIITILSGGTASVAVEARHGRTVTLANPPKTAKEFKSQWNGLVKQHPEWDFKTL